MCADSLARWWLGDPRCSTNASRLGAPAPHSRLLFTCAVHRPPLRHNINSRLKGAVDRELGGNIYSLFLICWFLRFLRKANLVRFLRIHPVQSVVNNITQLSGRGFPCIFYMELFCVATLRVFRAPEWTPSHEHTILWTCEVRNFENVFFYMCLFCVVCRFDVVSFCF